MQLAIKVVLLFAVVSVALRTPLPGPLAPKLPFGNQTDIAGLDVSSPQTAAFWTCARKTKAKVALRGYQQACGSVRILPIRIICCSINGPRGAKWILTSSETTMLLEQPGLQILMRICSHVSVGQKSLLSENLRLMEFFHKGTGTQPTGVKCKPVKQQLKEFLNAIDSNNLTLTRLWFDIEPTSRVCNAWNLGKAANEVLAKEWVAAIQATGRPWGIYANG